MNFEDWTTIEEGELVVLTAGAYSDYGILMIARALRRIDMAKRLRTYLERYPEQEEDHHFREAQFVAEALLVDLEPLQFRQAHLENYGSISDGWVKLQPPSPPQWSRFNRDIGKSEPALPDDPEGGWWWS